MIKKAMQSPFCAPKVEGCMLKPEYWIEKIGDAEKLILNEKNNLFSLQENEININRKRSQLVIT